MTSIQIDDIKQAFNTLITNLIGNNGNVKNIVVKDVEVETNNEVVNFKTTSNLTSLDKVNIVAKEPSIINAILPSSHSYKVYIYQDIPIYFSNPENLPINLKASCTTDVKITNYENIVTLTPRVVGEHIVNIKYKDKLDINVSIIAEDIPDGLLYVGTPGGINND